jgi:hypothetical protein
MKFLLITLALVSTLAFAEKPIGNATALQGIAISPIIPTLNQVLGFNGFGWIPTTSSASLTFADSLANSSGTVTLVNDSATPGNSKYYGTNSGGTLGYFSLPSGSGTVTSVALSDGSTSPFYTISGSPVTTSGTLTFTLATQSANCVMSGPSSGSAAQPTCRSLVGADLPAPSASTLGGVESLDAVSHKWINTISTAGVPSATQPAFTDISGSASGAQLPTFTGDVTNSGAAMFVAAIQGITVSGTTGSGNVVFSASPTFTGTITAASETVSGPLKSGHCHLEPAEDDIGNSGTAQSVNLDTYNVITTTLTGNLTITLSNPQAGCSYVFALTQDGTGSRTLTFSGVTVVWVGGVSTLTTTAGAEDLANCVYLGSSSKLNCALNLNVH